MEKTRNTTLKLAIGASASVAIFTLVFVVALITTFKMGTWTGLEDYAKSFRLRSMFTVVPSILLAISYLILNVCVHYLTDDNKRIWSHLAMNFGLVYITISIANYLIQLITVAPSIMDGSLMGLDKLVAGYPNSIFYALMGSYFFMCISLFFEGMVFEKKIRWFLFLASLVCVLFFVLGAATSISAFMIAGAVCWIVGTVVGMILISCFYKKRLIQHKWLNM